MIAEYSKLNERERLVWDVLEFDLPVARLARKHHVSHQTVRNIKMLKTQRAVAVHKAMRLAGVKTYTLEPSRRLTSEQVAEIRDLTTSSTVLAKRFGVSPSTIRMARSGLTYKES